MRALLLVLLLVAAAPVRAETAEERRYLFARQEAEAVLGGMSQSPTYNTMGALGQPEYMTPAFHAEYAQWQQGLEAQLRALIGPVGPLPPGFSREGVLNLDLCCYRRGYMLDGLSFRKGDESIVVTTGGLLDAWLDRNRDARKGRQDPNFYQLTGASDWGVLKARDLGDGALLASGGPEPEPHWIAFTVSRGQQVYIAFIRATTSDSSAEAKALMASLTVR